MGEIVRFRSPRPQQPVPKPMPTRRPANLAGLDDGWVDSDDPLIEDAYAAAFLAAERYERERRRERDLQSRIDALTRENARLREELARKG